VNKTPGAGLVHNSKVQDQGTHIQQFSRRTARVRMNSTYQPLDKESAIPSTESYVSGIVRKGIPKLAIIVRK